MTGDERSPDGGAKARRSGMGVLGTVVAVILVVAGLGVVAFYALFAIAMSSYGSNK